ncbi:hypothetical protein HYS72_00120 [Candidatus Pacearchaeota archaeon]|nr:hypothetical protein [Candidatus Pacearchaeota archaeon]MBI2056893.1 hypothetical protein [Candidatus Pacearchaeota archaeon]
MALEEGDLVLCSVDRIVGTVVFVKIEGEKKEGSIVLSEIAPGRIRNLRDYVVPKKKIVCKVLRISPERVDLSLRRVAQNEKKQIIEEYSQEKSYESILKSILGGNSKQIIDKIKEEESLYNFFEQVKKNPDFLTKLVGEENSKRIMQIISKQKTKKSTIKKEFRLTSAKSNGLELIKELLDNIKNVEINYLAAGKFSLKAQSEDPKKEEKILRIILEDIEKKAKEKGMEFSIKEK